MSGHEDFLPRRNEENHIEELSRLVESLAVELKLGSTPERKMSLAGPCRELAHRLYCHYSQLARGEQPRKQHPFGFGPETAN